MRGQMFFPGGLELHIGVRRLRHSTRALHRLRWGQWPGQAGAGQAAGTANKFELFVTTLRPGGSCCVTPDAALAPLLPLLAAPLPRPAPPPCPPCPPSPQMFIPTIMSQGSEEQQAYWLPKCNRLEVRGRGGRAAAGANAERAAAQAPLPRAAAVPPSLGAAPSARPLPSHAPAPAPPGPRPQIIGTYAQTELGHGTFVRGLETVAVYDEAARQFVIHSPTLSATKWYACAPAGAGRAAGLGGAAGGCCLLLRPQPSWAAVHPARPCCSPAGACGSGRLPAGVSRGRISTAAAAAAAMPAQVAGRAGQDRHARHLHGAPLPQGQGGPGRLPGAASGGSGADRAASRFQRAGGGRVGPEAGGRSCAAGLCRLGPAGASASACASMPCPNYRLPDHCAL